MNQTKFSSFLKLSKSIFKTTHSQKNLLKNIKENIFNEITYN